MPCVPPNTRCSSSGPFTGPLPAATPLGVILWSKAPSAQLHFTAVQGKEGGPGRRAAGPPPDLPPAGQPCSSVTWQSRVTGNQAPYFVALPFLLEIYCKCRFLVIVGWFGGRLKNCERTHCSKLSKQPLPLLPLCRSCCSVAQLCLTLRCHGLQHVRLPCPALSPGVCSDSGPLSWWCHPTISSSVSPFPPAFNLSQHQGLFQWVSSSHQVAKRLELQLQHQSFQWIFRTDFL